MFGSMKPASRKRPLRRAKRMGKGGAKGGAYQAGYDAAMRAMKSRSGTGRYGNARTTDTDRPSYGDDTERMSNPRYTPRVGWRF